jgi:hypothetical protein
MKNVLLPLALLCCTISTSFAQDYGRNREGRDNRMDPISELRLCEARSRNIMIDKEVLVGKLQECEKNLERNRGNRVDRERMDQLQRENSELISRNQLLNDQVRDLKIDIARLEIEAHPDRNGRFDLAESIIACGKISNSYNAQECAAAARANSIQATVIEKCASISNTYTALECVKTAGVNHVNARQIEACLEINNSYNAQQCIEIAGVKKLRADVIESCVKLTSNSYSQLECVRNL